MQTKIAIVSALLGLMVGFMPQAQAATDKATLSEKAQPVDADDPCTVFLCMAGKVAGTSPSECSAPQKTFFNIVKIVDGVFKPWETLDARKSFLDQCADADPKEMSKILNKFGAARG